MVLLEVPEKVANLICQEKPFMNETLRHRPILQAQTIELSHEERSQLNTMIDLLIPADDLFPPPSSLELLDELLIHLRPGTRYRLPRMLDVKRLRAVLHELNISAGGNFCQASSEKQQELLHSLEQHNPALFQELWTLITHSYYKRLAIRQPVSYSSQVQL
jgi:hypothetical protein